MTIKECYEKLGSDYEDVLRRFKYEKRIKMCLMMLLNDQNYNQLCQALKQQDFESAFIAVHTLKGVALNLGLTKLIDSCGQLTEILRPQKYDSQIDGLFQKVQADYREVTLLLKEVADCEEKEHYINS